MDRFSYKITIGTQLTWVIFSAILVFLFITASIFLYIKVDDLKQKHHFDAESLARVLSQDLTRVLLLNEQDLINDMVHKIAAFQDITHASMTSTAGRTILNYTRQGYAPVDFANSPANLNELQYIKTDVSYSGATYGYAYFYFRNTTFNEEFGEFLNRLWYIVPLLLVFSFIISLIAQKYFTRPILELSSAVNSFTKGKKQALNINTAHSKEMSDLFRGFQNMVDEISVATQLIADQKERLHIMLESIADGVIATDTSNNIIYLNPAAEKILHITEDEANLRPVQEIFPLVCESNNEDIESILDETIMTGEVHINLEGATVLLSDNTIIPVQSTVSPINDQHGEISGTIIIFQNVSEARELSEKLHHQATHDPLTGLINRSEFERRLLHLVAEADEHSNHALMYLDLDQFKLVNDTSGHTAGDALLVQLAGQFQGMLRDNDVVARLGGDEFAILLASCDLARASTIANEIVQKFSQFTFVWDERQFRIGVSIGLVPVTHNLISADELLRNADLACYVAKDTGRNRVHIYQSEDTLLVRRHNEMQWANLIRDAIDNDKLTLFAQHIRPMDSTNRVSHFEVLVRYQDDNNKMCLPGEFLPAVERYGLAPMLDRWVIKSVLNNQDIVTGLKANRNMHVNINLSGHTLNESSLVDYVAELLDVAQLPPRAICFEITETAAVSNLGATAHFMKKMRLLGCEFALDDFGSGVSSFSYLKNLPIDYLKIDGSFVKDIDKNPVNRAMVNAINDIGHVMRVKTIAEYVLNPDICEVLQSMDIDYAQGFYVHTPCPLQDIFATIHATCAQEVCS